MRTTFSAIALALTLVSCNDKTEFRETTINNTIDSVAVAAPHKPVANPIDIKTGTPPAPSSPIESIQKEVARINNGNLPSKRHDFMCDEKSYIVYHYDGKDIAKVTIDWGTVGDAYHREEFYYKNGKLIFDYDLLEGAGAYPGGDKKLERRHYVINDKAIKYLENQTEKPCEYCDYKKSSVAYRALEADVSKDYKGMLCR